MKDEYYIYTACTPPPPMVKARALSLKIFTISQVFRGTIIPYQQGLQWFEKKYSKYDV